MRNTLGRFIGITALLALAATAATSLSCTQEKLTRAEAREALEEAQISAQAEALTSASVDIATNFTIGMAVEAAAAELRAFVESQLPCAAITLTGATLTIEYGANPGSCVYRGQTWSGSHSITVMANQMSQVIVEHRWTDFQNQTVSVTGAATVTWDFSALTRHVVHEATWTRLSDGRQGVGRGDRTQETLEGGILEGIRVNGERTWSGESGEWTLDIDAVEMRWIDPVPQAGTYVLRIPSGKTVSLGFERVSSTEILVTVTGPRAEFSFTVTTTPAG